MLRIMQKKTPPLTLLSLQRAPTEFGSGATPREMLAARIDDRQMVAK